MRDQIIGRSAEADRPRPDVIFFNKDLLIPYLAPYLAYVAVASLPGEYLAREWNYVLRLALAVPLMGWGWKRYVSLTGPGSAVASVGVGVLGGVAGAILWVLLLLPFVESGGAPWSETAFMLRLLSAGLVVPIFEELLMRGYVLRVAYQWDLERKAGEDDPFGKAFYERSINQVEPGAWSAPAVAVSTVVFALGHNMSEWPAALAYGALMSLLWIVRKDLLSCIVAHSATNILLALYVLKSGQWGLW